MKNLNLRLLLKTFWVANFAIISFGWYTAHAENLNSGLFPNLLISVGSLLGLVATFLILTQFILISGARWMDSVWGLDRLAGSHRRNGKILFFAIIGHFTLIVSGYTLQANLGIDKFITTYLGLVTSAFYMLMAALAWYLILVIVVTSIVMVRKRLPYEVWHTIHFLTYIAAALPVLHQLQLGRTINIAWFAWYWIGLYVFSFGTLLYFKWIRPFWVYLQYRFVVDEVIPEANGVVSIYISGKNLDKFIYKAGQFAFWWFISKELWWQPHPFTISSSPGDSRLRITVKAIGKGSAAVQQVQPGTKLLIDGPYGRFTNVVQTHKKRLFIAGGIGVTPLASQLNSHSSIDDTLIYSARTMKDLALRKELSQTQARLIAVLSEEKLEGTYNGYLSENILTKEVKDLNQHDIWLCGPPPMMDGVEKMLLGMGVSQNQIHTERFRL